MKAELETGREAGREAGPGQIAIGTIWLAGVVLVTALVSPALALAEPISGAGAPSSSAPAADTPAALVHVEAARKLAGDDLKTPLFLCRPDSTAVVRQNLDSGSKQWLEPTKVFDNLSYVGNRFVGVWILRTSDGLILFDSSSSADEAEHHLVPGIRKLGLDPASIKVVVVTHGHWDHFGGAAYLQSTFGARVALGGADWDLIEKAPPNALATNNHPIPRRDLVVTDGYTLTLGDTKVKLYLTPGHTPATVSALVPVREAGKTYLLSLFGSVAFPPTLEPTPQSGGLRLYDRSVVRFGELGRKAGAVGLLNTHVFADGGLDRLAAARARQPGQPNPFLLGASTTARLYGILHECLLAAEARPPGTNDWNKPLPATPLAARPLPESSAAAGKASAAR
jgi:metallo-beta-lactamase class B